jgi:hypothetical protein
MVMCWRGTLPKVVLRTHKRSDLLVLLVTLARQGLRDQLAKLVLLVRQARLVLLGYKVTKARQDRRAMLVSQVRLDLLAHKVCKVLRVLRGLLVKQVKLDLLDRKA